MDWLVSIQFDCRNMVNDDLRQWIIGVNVTVTGNIEFQSFPLLCSYSTY